MPRLFIALDLLPGDISYLETIQYPLLDMKREVKAVRPSQFHLTLKFLGDQNQDTTDKLTGSFNRLQSPVQPCSFRFTGLGAFPSKKKPSSVWVGIEDLSGNIESLRLQVESLCLNLGIERETRPFKPHITLGRIRKNKPIPDKLHQFLEDNNKWFTSQFTSLTLYSSQLTQQGPVYTVLSQVNTGSASHES